MSIRGCDYDGAVRHERLDESTQDHGVRYVGALEFVEAQNGSTFCNTSCYERNRVDVVSVCHLHFMEVFVYALHERVEVYAGLVRDVRW